MLDPILDALIRERLPGKRYGVFFNVGEGDFNPDGTEQSSGHVVAEDGSIWFYWTGWNADRQCERLDCWEQIDSVLDPEALADDEEYQDARRAAFQYP